MAAAERLNDLAQLFSLFPFRVGKGTQLPTVKFFAQAHGGQGLVPRAGPSTEEGQYIFSFSTCSLGSLGSKFLGITELNNNNKSTFQSFERAQLHVALTELECRFLVAEVTGQFTSIKGRNARYGPGTQTYPRWCLWGHGNNFLRK